jgi:hypothetical protein
MTRQTSVAGIGVAVMVLALFVPWLRGESAAPAAEKPSKAPKDATAWKKLFDGKTLTGWKATAFGGEGKVSVKDGAIIMQQGDQMTGITYDRNDFPKMDYEVTLEGKKIEGNDFFCTTTFPVGKDHCSLVVGGWGGMVVGLSSINHQDASENETTTSKEFKQNQWYRLRIRVTKERIQAWIDNERVVNVETKDKKIDIRIECSLCKPFGLATWCTSGAVRDLRVRALTEAEKKEAAEMKTGDKD